MRITHRRRWLACLMFLVAPSTFADAPATRPADRLIEVREGTLPIILSAPHGGSLPVPGVTAPRTGGAGVVGKFVVVQDGGTDLLAERLADAIDRRLGGRPHLVVAHFARKYIDANRAPGDAYESPAAAPVYEAYHAALRSACDKVARQYPRGLLIDVHGQAAEPDGIFRGTANGKTVTALTDKFGRDALVGPEGVYGFLELTRHYKIIPPAADAAATEDARYNGGYTVRTYGSAAGGHVDAVQMEFGGNLRKKDRSQQTAEDVADAVTAFAKKYLVLKPEAGRAK